ncbi:M56 family metallopeptidase [Longimicrobium sp.]|uniref:M56 family metallopeptidase n=1 Tax=Longimicrobium sp. TaxID=2029185 RepID=UPI002B5E2649|nr:M56 family metallopeptidase [Longimicrobium sp.]HSU15632.1 M56 family metallopeptidase [Longimicrobium sp.]
MPVVTFALGHWVGWAVAWLATWLLHGTLLLGAAWIASLVVRSPGARDALWKTALAGSLATATIFVATKHGVAPPAAEITRRVLVDRAHAQAPLRTALPPLPAPGPVVPPWAPEIALAVWLAGALAGLARLEAGRRRYWRAAGDRHAIADAEAADTLRRLRAAARVKRTIYLTAADGLEAPVAIGSAEICLPAAALAALTSAQRESVIAHELGHLVRRDPLWKVGMEIAAAVLWFQPLLRVARSQMAESAELLCDGFAVRVTGRRRPLVEALGVLAAAFRPRGVAAAGFGDRGSPLVRRASRVLDATRAPARPLPAILRGALAAAALAGTLAFSPGVAPPPPGDVRPAIRRLEAVGVALNAGRTDVARIAPGGFLRLDENRDGRRRELSVTRGADGRALYDYRENGAPQPFDAPARRWMTASLAARR